MKPNPSGQFRLIDNPDRQFGNSSVSTWTWTRSDGLERLLTLTEPSQHMVQPPLAGTEADTDDQSSGVASKPTDRLRSQFGRLPDLLGIN